MPEGLELNPEKRYTALTPNANDPYLTYDLYLTFADGEWMKSVRITAPEDETPECIRQGLLLIADCEGGSLYDAANTLIFAVADNDDPEPFTIAPVETEIAADRADGAAWVTLRRTGGNQSMVSVTYESADGTAVAGRDYEKVAGEVSFYGDAAEQKILIPLIDDGKKDDEEKQLTLKLIGIKGDSAGVGSLDGTEVTLRLTNSGTGSGSNLATVLTDPDAIDLSGKTAEEGESTVALSPAAASGVQKDSGEPLTATIAGYDGDFQLQTYVCGTINFSRSNYANYESDYWTNTYDLIAAGPDWPDATKTNDGYKVSSTDNKTATLNIANMAQMYDGFEGQYGFSAGFAQVMSLLDTSYTYGWAAVTRADGTTRPYVDCFPYVEYGGFMESDTLHYTNNGSIDTEWDVTSDVAGLSIGTKRQGSYTSTNSQYSEITSAELSRRSFTCNPTLLIHTANDGEEYGLNMRTTPDGSAMLTWDSGVYASMEPTISLVKHESGIGMYGWLYVGSKIRVSLNKTASYFPYAGEELSAAVYLTRDDGTPLNAAVEAVDGTDDYIITLVWDGMTEEDLSGDFTVNVVMTRKQNLKIDLTPSVEHMKDAEGNVLASIDTQKIGEAKNLFWGSGNPYILYGYSASTSGAPHFGRWITQEFINKDSNFLTLDGTFLTGSDMSNVQWINFCGDPDDRILFNGRMYAGDERITLEPADLAQADLTFRYYHREYLSATSVMSASISSVGLYWDGDGNEKIDGAYNPNTGYFEIGSGSGDEFVMFLEPGTDYTETIFNYAENRNGDPCQMFLKIFYTMTPRALTPEPGQEQQRAQVLPALTTSVTDPDTFAALTDQQQSYRYVFSGKNGQGGYTSDGHPMFGAAATYANNITAKRQAERQGTVSNRQHCSLCGKHHTGGIVDNFIGIIHGMIWLVRCILLIAA